MTDHSKTEHGVDLSKLNYDQLTALISDAGKARDALHESRREGLLNEFKDRAVALGLDFASLVSGLIPGGKGTDAKAPAKGGRATGKGSRGAAPVKFRDPQGRTWTGRGRAPRWLVEAEAAGRKRADFAV